MAAIKSSHVLSHRAAVVALALTVLLDVTVACGESSTAPSETTEPPIVGIRLSPESVTLAAGGTQSFTLVADRADSTTLSPTGTWSATGGTIDGTGLYAAGNAPGSYRVIASIEGGSLADTAAVTISAAPPQSLFSEGFEDSSIAARGWYDATTVAITTDSRPGSDGLSALEWRWEVGTTAPQGSSRVDFDPSSSVYLSYWVKVSSNWVGSDRNYHPHMFHFLTDVDDRFIGPSLTHLTLYDELLYDGDNGGLTPVLSMQDALMIDKDNLLVDLTNVTEQRAIGGYNGQPEPGLNWDVFHYDPDTPTNYKLFRPGTLVMTDDTKSSWHHVESYWQLNTIQDGRGQPDGVVQYWFDDQLLIDRQDIYFRTAVNADMKFRTFVMAPYIGDGSPRDQYMWIDDIEIRTARE